LLLKNSKAALAEKVNSFLYFLNAPPLQVLPVLVDPIRDFESALKVIIFIFLRRDIIENHKFGTKVFFGTD
jgi:hypothetical protein